MASPSAQIALRAWVNARSDLVGEGNPIPQGAFVREIRSPADGAYVVLARQSEGVTNVTAEPGGPSIARIQSIVYAGTVEVAENAAGALRAAYESLSGCPELCGDTGVKVLVADNYLGPFAIPPAPDAGEVYAFQVNADFVLL